MLKLVKDGKLIDHSWQALRSDEEIQSTQLDNGKWLVPVERFTQLKQENPNAQLGCWASPDTDIELLKTISAQTSVVAIDFPVFMDGRGFSLARSLREHVDYEGEIRAIGHFIHDQIFYLARCGFNSFEFTDTVDEHKINGYLSSFTQSYQAGVDEPQPLFRRRA